MPSPSKNRSDASLVRRDVLSCIGHLGALALSSSFLSACHMGFTEPAQIAGKAFPAYDLPDLNGILYKSTSSAGKPVLINFWATWCPPCRSEMSALQSLADRFAEQGLQILGISVDDDLNLVREFVLQERLRFTMLIDRERVLAESALHLTAYPTSIVVGADGIVREVIVGVRPWADDSFARDLARQLGLV